MKRLLTVLAIVVAGLLLASCYRMSLRPTGTISISLGSATGRAISPDATVRVYLYTYAAQTSYALFTFPGGTQYVELPYGSGTATLSGIPVGVWQVLVSVGSGSGDTLMVDAAGASQVVSVVGGANTFASVTTSPSSFTYSGDLLGKDLNSVFFDYSYDTYSPAIYVSATAALYTIGSSANYTPPDLRLDLPSSIVLPAGLQIQSLSRGLESNPYGDFSTCLFVNSNMGIVPYQYGAGGPSGFDTLDFSSALLDKDGNPRTVIDSRMVEYYSQLNQSYGVPVYFTDKLGSGGAYLVGGTNQIPFNVYTKAGAPWVDITLSGSPADQPVFLYGLSVDHDYPDLRGFAYFATNVGAFRVDHTLTDTTSPNAGKLSSMVSIPAPNNEQIEAIAVDDWDGVLYVGTRHGAYYATLNETSTTSAITGGWTPVPMTSGDDIVSIKVDISNGYTGSPFPVPAAFRSRYNLYVVAGPPALGNETRVYPFYSGLPGEVRSMDFVLGTLYIAGTKGLVSVKVT